MLSLDLHRIRMSLRTYCKEHRLADALLFITSWRSSATAFPSQGGCLGTQPYGILSLKGVRNEGKVKDLVRSVSRCFYWAFIVIPLSIFKMYATGLRLSVQYIRM